MRVFFAIEFEEEIKEYIYEKLLDVKKKSIKGSFSRKENIHLTLKFMGEVSNSEMKELSQVIDLVVSQKSSFILKMNRLGKFDRGNQCILWIGLEKSEALFNLYKELEEMLWKLGYEKESRGFAPHITLGRQVTLKSNEFFSDIPISKRIKIKKISLMESTRVKGVLTYRPVYSREFGN